VISRFFIDRPVFSMVLSILIVLIGTVSMLSLPIARLPEITPPGIVVSTTYPGASAETVAQSVAAPIEQQLSGAKHLLYFKSQSSNDGSMSITATFDIGSDQDLAAVEVQNRLAVATPRLPDDVRRQGITVTKTSTDILCVVALKSRDAQYNELFLSNYATINLVDTLKRIPGVGDVNVFGAKDYAMRVWVNPDTLAAKGMTVTDVANSIREQNAVFAAGRLGQQPNPEPVELTMPVLTQGRLDTEQQYRDIILRANPDGSMVKVDDVARVELGAQSYDLFGRLSGTPTTLVIVYLQTGANALGTIAQLQKTMQDAAATFPRGVDWEIPYNPTRFVTASVNEVVHTIIEAIVLVLLVVFVFLQNWRATLIPLLAVPVSIIGTFAGMLALGFTINTLTLFGMVLAIGIVVDDAIVVVENVERIMDSEHLPVREATIKAMSQVTGPVIAVVLVLSAVFLPVAFLGGLTGQVFKQFAITIAISVAISGLVALTLSPALCALLLRPTHGRKLLPARAFNWAFDRVTRGFTAGVRVSVRNALITLLVFAAIAFSTVRLFEKLPTGFLPDEDQGYIIGVAILPEGASLERTNAFTHRVEDFFINHPAVENTVCLGGLNLLAGRSNATNAAVIFVPLKPWDSRRDPKLHASAVIADAAKAFGGSPEGLFLAINPPSVPGLGQRAGFEVQLQSRGSADVRRLGEVTADFLRDVNQRPEVRNAFSTYKTTSPQLFIELDRTKTKMMGVPVNEVFNSLQAYLGSLYVNDFDKFGRVWRVQLQAEPRFRTQPKDVERIWVRNSEGEMVPLAGVVTTRFQAGPNGVAHFNGFPSVEITGEPRPGFSTGDALRAIREVAAQKLPPGYAVDVSGASYQEEKAGGQAGRVIGFGIIVVFLVLAAQYEKWSLPIAVLATVPIAVLGALVAIWIRGISKDLYFQIGLLTLVGLAAKNAILIVEFCVELRRDGHSIRDAAIEASRLRFRPIVMTSLAFILGVLPLVIAQGAGAASRWSIGTAVMGGMLAATFIATFFVPMFYFVIQWTSEKIRGKTDVVPHAPTP
jgi:multidrug efflux pump